MSGLSATEVAIRAIRADARRALAEEVSDALGDVERLPVDVAARFADLLHRWRTGREG